MSDVDLGPGIRYRPPTTTSAARILLVSMRNLSSHVSRCAIYELEDSIRDFYNAEILAPSWSTTASPLFVRIRRAMHRPRTICYPSMSGKYDLMLVVASNPADLRHLPALNAIRQICRKSACFLSELWTIHIPKFRNQLLRLADFDAVFTPSSSSVTRLSELLGSNRCHHLLSGVDAIKFCPYPVAPLRSVDVYSVGRRPPLVHRGLMQLAQETGRFYVYDTVTNFSVMAPEEHRKLFSEVVKRSRYFIAYPAKFDRLQETQGQEELGYRYYEGAAGGAVMLGLAPRCPDYDQNFDWDDAVIPVSAVDPMEIRDVIIELDAQPDRIARIRQDNVINSLLKNDWVYRWGEILEILGLSPSEEMVAREQYLKRLAREVLRRSSSLLCVSPA